MRKYTVAPLLVIITLTSMLIVSCQKQDAIITEPPIHNNNNSAARATDSTPKDYRIPLEKATADVKRWQDRIKDQPEGQYPKSIEIPMGGIEQLINEAKKHNVSLESIRLYIGVDENGKLSGTYVPVDEAHNDILQYGGEANYTRSFETYDFSATCPSTCRTKSNALNTP